MICRQFRPTAATRHTIAKKIRLFERCALFSTQQSTRKVALQLDYYYSAQYAGVAVAERQGLYTERGLELIVLPDCHVGTEAKSVREYQDAHPEALAVGTAEQNVLVPALARDPSLRVRAVAAMFHRSPLGLAALPGGGGPAAGRLLAAAAAAAAAAGQPPSGAAAAAAAAGLRVGAHEDTADLLRALLPGAEVVACHRDDKLGRLLAGEIDAVQVYDVMETHALEGRLGAAPAFVPLAALGARLGYSQVVFAPAEALLPGEHEGEEEGGGKRAALGAFLEATFEGWRRAVADPAAAAREVAAAMAARGVRADHWPEGDPAFQEAAVRRCCDYVKATSRGGRLGVLDAGAFDEASRWLLRALPGLPPPDSFDSLQVLHGARDGGGVWREDPRLMFGKGLADAVRATTRGLAAEAAARRGGRRPSVAILTVGAAAEGAGRADAARRLQLYSPADASWFGKTASGAALGIDAEEVHLPAEATTEDVLAEIARHAGRDGLQLMWPLPPQVDAARCYAAVPPAQDVDGAHYLARAENAGGHAAAQAGRWDPLGPGAPVAPAGVARLLAHYKVPVAGRKAVVVGRSRIVGQPLAYMLTALGATVTLAHAETPLGLLEAECRSADILIPCIGKPDLLKPEWVKPGAAVVCVGKSFQDDRLVGDLDDPAASLAAGAALFAPAPGGLGPLSVALLFENVALAALAHHRPSSSSSSSSSPEGN